MSDTMGQMLIDNGFERSPFGNHSFKWADGHTAVYVEPHETGGYTVSTYRPYGTRVFKRGAVRLSAAVTFALSQVEAAPVDCNHTWVGGMMYVHDDEAEDVNAHRLANGADPLECERCDAQYPGESS